MPADGPRYPRINLITNTQSAGLWQDVCTFSRLFTANSISFSVHNNFLRNATYPTAYGADISIFLESLNDGRLLDAAKTNWVAVNDEWWLPELYDRYLPLISLILCKTRNSYRIWHNRVGSRALYCGFESRDMLDDQVQSRNSRFLHVMGKSDAKGTNLIAEACKWVSACPLLTLVTCSTNAEEYQVAMRLANLFKGNKNVTHLHSITDDELRYQYNLHRFVLAPSLMEGFGHCLREAMSAKCVILTTDAPPMNEINSIPKEFRIPVVRSVPRLLTEFHYVGPWGIAEAVSRAIRMGDYQLDTIGECSRKEWLNERDFFRKTVMEAINKWETYL